MTASAAASDAPLGADARVADLLEDLVNRLQAGEAVDVEAVLAAHPEHADALRRVLPAAALLAELGNSGQANVPVADGVLTPASGVLGDFRLIREVGRGGMGTVYEAEQLSLGRRVAVKVLPFVATMDARHLQRFHNEARAAASLHHAHIVPVYAVGYERAVHFYAMQLIDGPSLAEVIAAHDLATQGRGTASTVAGADTQSDVIATTLDAPRDAGYFRRCAQWGLEAAEALEHAHALGIVHRDVKPANLIVDGQGKVWITDFGLAHCQNQSGPTVTGDLVGTLRYMSPEQALGRRELVDGRSDVYSLGATLYELLTLKPVFTGNREELLRQIAQEEPQPPRRIDAAIPVDLETIVLTAIAKNPAERYASAQAMADDLRHYLEDRPITARRPTIVQCVRRFCRRHQALVWSAAACSMITVLTVVGSLGWITGDRAARQAVTDQQAGLALADSLALQQQDKWFEAGLAIERAQALLADGGGSPEIRERVRRRRADLDLVAAVERIQLDSTASLKDGAFDIAPRDAAYLQAFRSYGINVHTTTRDEAADVIRASSACAELAAALDDWAIVRRTTRPRDNTWRDLLAIARVADPDADRNRVRDALERRDAHALEAWTAADRAVTLPPSTVLLVVRVLRGIQAAEQGKVRDELTPHPLATRLLRKAQRQHPQDFWLTYELAWQLASAQPPHWGEPIRCYSVARALRPHSALVHVSLSYALLSAGRTDDAIACCQDAIRLDPNLAPAHNNLGYAHRLKGELDEAIRCYRQAIDLDPGLASAHNNLGNAMKEKGRWDEAIRHCQEAIRLRPSDSRAAHNLRDLLLEKGQTESALAECAKRARAEPTNAPVQCAHGIALMQAGRLKDAIDAFDRAIQLEPNNAAFHSSRGAVLRRQGRLKEAMAAYRKAIELAAKFAGAYSNLAWLLSTSPDETLRDPAAAVAAAKTAVKLAQPRELATCWQRLGVSQYRAGDAKAAVAALRKSIDLSRAGDGVDYFFLAMAHGKLGDNAEATRCYRQALTYLAKPPEDRPRRFYQPLDDELRRFDEEAAQLLGVDE